MALVHLTDVRKTYARGGERIEVLRGIDLAVEDGDFLALMGPSGSGKTTLLNIIGGIDSASGGTVLVAGQELRGLGSRGLARWRAAHIGYVFQFYNLLPVLSARRNVEMPLLLTKLGGRQRRTRAEMALELVGLVDRAGHRPAELSGGQQQRVAIARAIVADPPILVCDEPTGDLDRETADDILSLLRELNAEHGKTILMVTHDPRAAEQARRTLHLDKGVLKGTMRRAA